jgi:hypothetical protein
VSYTHAPPSSTARGNDESAGRADGLLHDKLRRGGTPFDALIVRALV